MYTMILKALFDAFIMILKMLAFLIAPIMFLIFLAVILFFYHFIKFRYVEHMKMKPITAEIKKKPNIFKTLFYLFPKQLAYDVINKDPMDFGQEGIYICVGEQGSGKSMTAVYLMEMWKERWPKAKVYTNMGYLYEDAPLEKWRQLIERKNGTYGVINVIDDIKAWWSNRDSKNLPPEVMAEICQQRKQRKALIGTIQVFSEAPKPLRSQTKLIYVPHTYLGCLTVVFKTKAKWYDSEKDDFRKYCGMFIFAHTPRLRGAYDTYKKIEKYKDTEWEVSPYFQPSGSPSDTVGGPTGE